MAFPPRQYIYNNLTLPITHQLTRRTFARASFYRFSTAPIIILLAVRTGGSGSTSFNSRTGLFIRNTDIAMVLVLALFIPIFTIGLTANRGNQVVQGDYKETYYEKISHFKCNLLNLQLNNPH